MHCKLRHALFSSSLLTRRVTPQAGALSHCRFLTPKFDAHRLQPPPRIHTDNFTPFTMDQLANGSHQSIDDLARTLNAIGLSKVPQEPDTYPNLNPVDIYRSHITEKLAEISGVDPKIIYPVLQWTQTLDKGDLVLPVPALRLKGKNPKELTAELGEKVPASTCDLW